MNNPFVVLIARLDPLELGGIHMPNNLSLHSRDFVKRTGTAIAGAELPQEFGARSAQNPASLQATGLRIGEGTDISAIIWTHLASASKRMNTWPTGIQQSRRTMNSRMRKPPIMALLIFCSLTALRGQSPNPPIRNGLFMVSDDLRAGALGCYGNKTCKTPNIDKLAKGGLVFDRAYCQGSWCLPSRTSFMYSRYKGGGQVTLAQHFKENGFYSARSGKIFHMAVPDDIMNGSDGADVPASWTERFNSRGSESLTPGDYACMNLNVFTNGMQGRQSSGMPHRMFVSVICDGDGSDQPDYKTAAKTIELLQKHKDSPFFIAAGFVRPHYPMVAPRKYFEPYRWQEMQLPEQVGNDLDDIPEAGRAKNRSANNGLANHPENQKRMWAAYYAAVAFMDAQVGRVLDELERLGLRQTTAIVFISDQGYHLADHTFWEKANIHEQVTRVPLILSVPGFAPGRSDSIAELVDLFPTLSELAGLPAPIATQGTSLVPILKDHSSTVKEGALSFNNGSGWRTKDWAYLRYTDGSEELYDMQADPGQITNLASDPKHAGELKKMARSMDQRLKAVGLGGKN